MPKKSSKSKSKRQTLRAKYKVIRKVKEHHRKKRKELKKQGGKPKAPKDPGLPAQWPFKEDLIKEFAFKRAQILADEKRKKEEKKARRLVSWSAKCCWLCESITHAGSTQNPVMLELHAVAGSSVW
jgi:hypothetical protein